ncbi:MAG: cell division protein FtsQ/DivIB [Chromatiaceae bacterium]
MSRADTGMQQGVSAEAPRVRRSVWRGLFAAVLTGLMAGGGYALLQWEPRHLPVRVVTVKGEVRHLSRERLVQSVLAHLRGGILTQDLSELKGAVEAMPWVRSASLRRVWPDRLELEVEERRPLARWGDDGLVTAEGVVFRPHDEGLSGGLPHLAGTDEQAPVIVRRFMRWRRQLAAQGIALHSVTLDARGAWTLRCDRGLTVRLGISEVEQRVRRFLHVYPSVVSAGRPERMDMRYSNGLAVRWSDGRPGDDGPSAGSVQAASFLPRSAASGPGHSRS